MIDSLFFEYQKNQKQTLLIYDLYDFAKWQYKYGSLKKAIELNNKSLLLIESVSLNDIELIRKVIFNSGFYSSKNGDFLIAFKNYERLKKFNIVDELSIRAYHQSAYNAFLLGDYYYADELYDNAITFSRNNIKNNTFIKICLEASINCKRINTEKSLKKGIDILNSALKLAIESNKSSKDSIDDLQMYLIYDHLGNLYNDRVDYDFRNSLLNYDNASFYAKKLNDKNILADINNDIGYLYLHKKSDKALEYFQKALTYNPIVETKSIIYRNLAEYYLIINEKQNALNYIQKSINVLININVTDHETLPSKDSAIKCKNKYLLLLSLIDKSKIWMKIPNKNEHYELALEALKLADYLVDLIRLESIEFQSKLFWRKIASEIYGNAVKACFNLDNHKDGFYFMEKSKSILLLEDVKLNIKNQNSNIKSKQLFIQNSEPFNSKNEKNLLVNSKETITVISINQAKNSLVDNNSVYIEYLLNDDFGYGIVITKTNSIFFELKNAEDLKLKTKQFRKLLEQPFNSPQDVSKFNTYTYSVYNVLFPSEIKNVIMNKKLTIIPDYYLQNIPFEALQTSNKTNSYLIENNEINYAYSISFLSQNKKISRNNEFQYVGFAPTFFNYNLPTLYNSSKEIRNVAKLFSSNTFYNENATKNNFINQIKNHNIIHIASHANASDSIMPWVAFNDSKVYIEDIYNTTNSAELVVLSACNTSLGEIYEGEGVMSLSRGFFNTGANSVISTLWSVNDKSTAEIINEFFTNLKEGSSKSNALHKAKLNYIKNHSLSESSPYYWSSLILIGDAGKIPIESENYTFTIISFITLFILLILIYKIK